MHLPGLSLAAKNFYREQKALRKKKELEEKNARKQKVSRSYSTLQFLFYSYSFLVKGVSLLFLLYADMDESVLEAQHRRQR